MSAFKTAVPSSVGRAGVTAVLTLAVAGGTMFAPGAAPPARAATAHAWEALRVAASKQGAPYQWGATGPNRFDCSGLTQYSYKRAGKSLPRTAAQQARRTRPIVAGSRQEGDLVFFRFRGRVYHVGVYAGDDMIWHSPKPGSRVRLEKIWTDNVSYGRVS
ncbi:glycoside hydrolase [Streptomyces venezuelae]|uniref:Glycoside hydrolase n=1 Tax=Streptomyces venezuelae TaxID=54571 RepID=A0A5P2DAQ0_STRVZ|nr:C40 family peptidase [Streptomyces venezuelae]QES51287.1 glycoside hydrolase [Streptomyces venezuelae]